EPAAAAPLTVRTAQMPGVPGRAPRYQNQNETPLLGTPGNLGGKTGFTDAARHTFVTAAERDGRRLVVSVMRTENRPLRAADQAALLLDWGFAVPAGTDGVGRLVRPADVARPSAGTPAPSPRRVAAAPSPTPSVRAGAEPGASPLIPAALGGAAVLIVAATLLGRRRAVRPVRTPPGEATPPRSAGGSTSTRP
ncbi:MAG: D-alanyl-D-alanine carboxypeptidase, partial [Actinomycetes bacterium]